MPRDEHAEARRRHTLLPPEAMTAQRPFLLDARRRRVFGSWPKKRASPGDEDRLMAALASLNDVTLPDWLVWIWADGRPPEPVRGVGDGWLAHGQRDHDVYHVAGP